MMRLANLKHQVRALAHGVLAPFRAWFLEYDSEAWDAEIERDVSAGRLDVLAERALQDHADGKTTPL